MRFRWIAFGLLAALTACGAPVDERARVAGVLQDDRGAAPRTTASAAAPSPILQREARNPAPVVMAAPVPRSVEASRRPVVDQQAAATSATRREMPVRRVEPEPTPQESIVETIEPARLVGLGRSELANLMGTPMILRNESPGELWLYKNDACVAHIYLYEKSGPEDYEVSYVETRGNDSALSSAQCLAAFAATSAVSLNEDN